MDDILLLFLDMEKRFINLSNHPISTWTDQQLEAAQAIGNLEEMSFPEINPMDGEKEIDALAETYKKRIVEMRNTCDVLSVHLMGEMTFTFSLVHKLTALGIDCYASTSKRMVSLNADGDKIVHFEFARFRKYLL